MVDAKVGFVVELEEENFVSFGSGGVGFLFGAGGSHGVFLLVGSRRLELLLFRLRAEGANPLTLRTQTI